MGEFLQALPTSALVKAGPGVLGYERTFADGHGGVAAAA